MVPEELSLDVQQKLLHPIRVNSEATYDSYYCRFRDFIVRKYGADTCFPLTGVIEYFNVAANRGYLSSTLRSIRTSLRDPLRLYFPAFDILYDPFIKKIIQFVKSKQPKRLYKFPAWNLDLVVQMLKIREDRDMAFVFKKTLFITFLACPYRISEFKAISLSMSAFSPLHVTLKTHPNYYSKNATDTFSPAPIILQQFAECSSLCPVVLLNTYRDWTNSLCAERGIDRPDQFWLNSNLKPLTNNEIRKWVRDIIFLADPQARVKGTNVHSIRAQIASALFASGFTIKEVMGAMSWRSDSTFTRYYSLLGLQTSVSAVLAGHLPAV